MSLFDTFFMIVVSSFTSIKERARGNRIRELILLLFCLAAMILQKIWKYIDL